LRGADYKLCEARYEAQRKDETAMSEMQQDNELVVIEMPSSELMRLLAQINARMEELGYPQDIEQLIPGLNLPCGWPLREEIKPTLAQLVVIAKRLKMKLIITNIYMDKERIINDTGISQ